MNSETLDFVIFCVSSVAERMKMSARDVYRKMSNYIIPCYDVLHTFSKQYITDDLISVMKEKGVVA